MINTILEDYQMFFPQLWKRTATYWENSSYELFARLDDDSVIIFDDIEKTVRRLPKNIDNLTEQEFKNEFGRRIRALMYRKGLTQEDLSNLSGISQSQLSGYITGRINPSFYKAYKIAEALDCSIDHLLYISDKN